ncbi:Crossover junction endonuclease mus81 [Ancistrocladus abbreviatus]
MEDQKRVECLENQALAEYMWKKMQEMTQNPKGLSENRQMILHRAYYSGIASRKESMRKQELIDEAEASGLSRAPIA